jgi:RecA/RadA recombinase
MSKEKKTINRSLQFKDITATIKRFLSVTKQAMSLSHCYLYKWLKVIISTGATSIDSLLSGGIRSGMVTDFYGQSGTGKSQLCFTLCVNCAGHVSREETIMFIDTTGNFRPERIEEIAAYKNKNNNNRILNRINYVRSFSTSEQLKAVNKITEFSARLIIIDNISLLFSNEFGGVDRHLALMKYMHRLCLAAINFDCAVVITNMSRYAQTNDHFIEREFMGSSVSLYSHMRLKLEIVDLERSMYKATLLQPALRRAVFFSIKSKGISDYQ